jgi:hypothetical protein
MVKSFGLLIEDEQSSEHCEVSRLSGIKAPFAVKALTLRRAVSSAGRKEVSDELAFGTEYTEQREFS